MRKVDPFVFFRTYGILVVLLLLIVFFSVMTDSFFSMNNLFNVARQISMLSIVAVGMTFVMLAAGIDLSVGSVLALSGVIGATLMVRAHADPWLAIIGALAGATLVGLINGFLVAYVDIPPLISTLGMMTIVRGLSFIITGGLPVYGLPKGIQFLGQGYVWRIPVPVILMAAFFLVGVFILNFTYFGRYFYALGGNEEATRLSGVNVSRMKLLVYSLCGFMAGVAGVIMLSRINSGQPNSGSGFELDVVTAVVLGGVSISGGEGKLGGVLIGAFIMGILSNGMIIMSVGEYYQLVIKGAVLLAAVGFDRMAKRARKRSLASLA